jgi:hypothetical protein
MSLEERRAAIARRNTDTIRTNDRARYYRHWDERRAVADAWIATHPGAATDAKAAWAERNPAKRRAHNIVARAIRRGQLKRGPCEVCGAGDAEAHHDDYDLPLDVRWLCRRHHAEHHRKG